MPSSGSFSTNIFGCTYGAYRLRYFLTFMLFEEKISSTECLPSEFFIVFFDIYDHFLDADYLVEGLS
jgi:hypothetical protein